MEKLKEIALNHKVEYIALLPFYEKEGFSSVVVALLPYYSGEAHSRLSKYTRGKDYHKVGRKILSVILDEWGAKDYEILIDVSPFNEKKLAYEAGLGFRGRNGLIINEKYGSFVFIATALLKREVSCSYYVKGNCIGCNRCVNACPGGAIKEDGVDYSKCLSLITQKRSITPEEETLIKQNGKIWGCDVCQDCCPLNRKVPLTPFPDFAAELFDITDIDSLSNKEFKLKYGEYSLAYKGKGIIARNIKLSEKT